MPRIDLTCVRFVVDLYQLQYERVHMKSKSVPVQAYISEDMRDQFRAAYTLDGFPSDSSAMAQLIREYVKKYKKSLKEKA